MSFFFFNQYERHVVVRPPLPLPRSATISAVHWHLSDPRYPRSSHSVVFFFFRQQCHDALRDDVEFSSQCVMVGEVQDLILIGLSFGIVCETQILSFAN